MLKAVQEELGAEDALSCPRWSCDKDERAAGKAALYLLV